MNPRDKRCIVFAIVLALTGCVRAPAPVIQAKLDDLKGHSLKEVLGKLGSPSDETETADGKTYIWRYAPVIAQCTLKVAVNKDGRIANYNFNGTVSGCGYFAHLLDSSYRQVQDLLNFPSKDEDMAECREKANDDPTRLDAQEKSCMIAKGYRYWEIFNGCNGKDLPKNSACYAH